LTRVCEFSIFTPIKPGFPGFKDSQEFKFTENMLPQRCETLKSFKNISWKSLHPGNPGSDNYSPPFPGEL
jgi:hypothetical protein